MKILLSAVLLLSFASCVEENYPPQTVHDDGGVGPLLIGREVAVINFRWVNGINPLELGQQHKFQGSTRTCLIKPPGKLAILGVDEDAEWLLVEYKFPMEAIAAPCPSGTFFFIDATDFLAVTEEDPVIAGLLAE